MPNSIAYLALLVWPVVAVGLFRALPIERALVWSILAPYLLLPQVANFDFPLVPPLDKTSLPNLSAALAVLLVLGRRVPLLPDSVIGKALMVLFVVSPLATVLTNRETSFGSVVVVPGLSLHDSVSVIVKQAIFILPLFLARHLLATERAQREILLALVLAGLAYSLPTLLEIRLSPQLSIWIYGFFPHRFDQMVRGDGFRPIVFTPHALWLAFFMMTTVLAAAALWRASSRESRAPFLFATVYLFAVLVLCKSLGSVIYALALLPAVLLLGPKMQIRIALAFAALAILYPLLRGAGLVPVEAILDQARAISEARAQSLGFRFQNEELLLERAGEKPLFGWGGWGRNKVFNPEIDREAVADGRWVIVIGIYGWLGYIVEFGLLGLPLLLLARRMGGAGARLSPHAGPLALILGINMIDLLPNATLIPFTWLLAGALLGHAEALKAGQGAERPEAEPARAPPRRRTIL